MNVVLATIVILLLGALAVVDATRLIVHPGLVAALLVAAAAWHVLGDGRETVARSWWSPASGAALGVAAVALPIAAATAMRRRWPIFPGDGLLLGAFGFLLGPLGLAWSLGLGAAAALAHRVCLQRRRGRPVLRGYCPLAPGLALGAGAVFLALNAGVALGQDDPAPTAAPLLPVTVVTAATALLPPAIAGREVAIAADDAVAWPVLARRVAAAGGLTARIEDRPSRIAGQHTVLADPAPVALEWTGRLDGALDRAAALAGHGWEYAPPSDIVFYRYADPEWAAAMAAMAASAAPADGTAASEPPGETPLADVAAAAVPAVEADGAPEAPEAAAVPAPPPPPPPEPWVVDPAAHGTLRVTLGVWAVRAGWSLVWRSEADFTPTARAEFGGGFLTAVDDLLSDPATRRSLTAVAYEANRQLVIDDAGRAPR